MPTPTAASFDPKTFLEKVGTGKRILNIPKGREVFSQSDAADTVFYLQTGRIEVHNSLLYAVLDDKLHGESSFGATLSGYTLRSVQQRTLPRHGDFGQGARTARHLAIDAIDTLSWQELLGQSVNLAGEGLLVDWWTTFAPS